jgi:hypothetical protein
MVNETSPGGGADIISANDCIPEVVDAAPLTVMPLVTRFEVVTVLAFRLDISAP